MSINEYRNIECIVDGSIDDTENQNTDLVILSEDIIGKSSKKTGILRKNVICIGSSYINMSEKIDEDVPDLENIPKFLPDLQIESVQNDKNTIFTEVCISKYEENPYTFLPLTAPAKKIPICNLPVEKQTDHLDISYPEDNDIDRFSKIVISGKGKKHIFEKWREFTLMKVGKILEGCNRISYLSELPIATIDVVRTFRSYPWNFESLAGNRAISIIDILNTKDEFPWSQVEVTKRLQYCNSKWLAYYGVIGLGDDTVNFPEDDIFTATVEAPVFEPIFNPTHEQLEEAIKEIILDKPNIDRDKLTKAIGIYMKYVEVFDILNVEIECSKDIQVFKEPVKCKTRDAYLENLTILNSCTGAVERFTQFTLFEDLSCHSKVFFPQQQDIFKFREADYASLSNIREILKIRDTPVEFLRDSITRFDPIMIVSHYHDLDFIFVKVLFYPERKKLNWIDNASNNLTPEFDKKLLSIFSQRIANCLYGMQYVYENPSLPWDFTNNPYAPLSVSLECKPTTLTFEKKVDREQTWQEICTMDGYSSMKCIYDYNDLVEFEPKSTDIEYLVSVDWEREIIKMIRKLNLWYEVKDIVPQSIMVKYNKLPWIFSTKYDFMEFVRFLGDTVPEYDWVPALKILNTELGRNILVFYTVRAFYDSLLKEYEARIDLKDKVKLYENILETFCFEYIAIRQPLCITLELVTPHEVMAASRYPDPLSSLVELGDNTLINKHLFFQYI